MQRISGDAFGKKPKGREGIGRKSRTVPATVDALIQQRLMPFFNRQNNDDLILAIQAAGVTRGRNGFHKDKGGEKLGETEEDLLEHRTDGTDAFDTLFIGCEKFPQSDTSAFSVDINGVM